MQKLRTFNFMGALILSSFSLFTSSAEATTACQDAGVTHQVKCCYRQGTLLVEEQLEAQRETLCRVQGAAVESLLHQAPGLGCGEEEPLTAFRAGLEGRLDHSCR